MLNIFVICTVFELLFILSINIFLSFIKVNRIISIMIFQYINKVGNVLLRKILMRKARKTGDEIFYCCAQYVKKFYRQYKTCHRVTLHYFINIINTDNKYQTQIRLLHIPDEITHIRACNSENISHHTSYTLLFCCCKGLSFIFLRFDKITIVSTLQTFIMCKRKFCTSCIEQRYSCYIPTITSTIVFLKVHK